MTITHARRVMLNGDEITVGVCADECDYCGEIGHTWHQHGEARADVIAWQREAAATA